MIRTATSSLPLPAATLVTPQRRRYYLTWWLRIGLILAIFTLVGVLEAGQSMMMQYLANRPFSSWRALVLGLADWYIWAALTPLVLWAAQLFPLIQRNWPLSLLLHVVLSIMCATIVVVLMIPVMERVQQSI